MALRSEIELARDRYVSDLREAHDYYYRTKVAWRLIRQQVDRGLRFELHNRLTDSSITETELLSLSQRYTAKELTSATLQQFVAIFESFLYEVMRLWLLSYPKSLSARQLKAEDIFRLPDKAAIINAVVETELQDIFYGRPAKWFDELQRLANITSPTDVDKEQFSEVKATRDVLGAWPRNRQ